MSENEFPYTYNDSHSTFADRAAVIIAAWYKKHGRMVFDRCKMMLKNTTYPPEEAMQDVFIAALNTIRKNGIISIQKRENWLYVKATSFCLSILRTKKKSPHGDVFYDDGEEIFHEDDPWYDKIEKEIILRQVYDMLETESEEMQLYFQLRHKDGMKLKDIVKLIDKSDEWIRKKRNAFYKRVREKLGDIR